MNWYHRVQAEADQDLMDIMQEMNIEDRVAGAVKKVGSHIRVSVMAIVDIISTYGMKMAGYGGGTGGNPGGDPYQLWFTVRSTDKPMRENSRKLFDALSRIPLKNKLEEHLLPEEDDPGARNMRRFTMDFPLKAVWINNVAPKARVFSPGTKVRKSMGVKLEGVIIPSFPWDQSNDGTYRAPNKEEVPIRWKDNTKGYENKANLEIME